MHILKIEGIDLLISTVVSSTGIAFTVLVSHDGSNGLHHWHWCEILWRYELKSL